MAVSLATYEQVALEDREGAWELVGCGQLRSKPGMTMWHNSLGSRLGSALIRQLDDEVYEVRLNSSRGATPDGQRFIPDICVVPVAYMATLQGSARLETYEAPLPFVAEVWSPSTGDYDVEPKFPGYKARGHRVIWRIHPQDRTVTAWVLRADGSYAETVHTSGVVDIPSLLGAKVDLRWLFR
jgi:Uma2 family endonuclease